MRKHSRSRSPREAATGISPPNANKDDDKKSAKKSHKHHHREHHKKKHHKKHSRSRDRSREHRSRGDEDRDRRHHSSIQPSSSATPADSSSRFGNSFGQTSSGGHRDEPRREGGFSQTSSAAPIR